MSTLLHISASPRGERSESLAVAATYLDTFRAEHPDVAVETWDLWDGTLPAFGPEAVGAKMAVFGGAEPAGEQATAWRAARAAFERFAAADRLLLGVPMWNGGIPYILKQFIDVVSQPGMVFGVDPVEGYSHLLAGRGRRAAIVYTSAVWGPALGPEFGRDFQSTYLEDWLTWTGITDLTEIRFHPTLAGDAVEARTKAHAVARDVAASF